MNKEILLSILETVSVSGNEQSLSNIFAHQAQANAMTVEKDVMGNTYAYMKGATATTDLLIESHCDEIGFQVIHISDSGYIYIRRNGGIDEQCIPGTQLIIQSSSGELISGVIGKKPIHLLSMDDRKRTIELHQLWLDTGLEPDEVKAKIQVGDFVAIRPNVIFLGSNKITSKALDNKLGVYALTQIMNNVAALDRNVCFTATVQEEVGSRGAVVCAHRINPKVSITIDLDFATDVPDCNPTRYGRVSLGEGVIIPRNVDCDLALSSELERLAKGMNIPFQISARPHATGGTNTSRIQLTKDGIRTISLGIPCRYMHTPVEVCDMRDVEACIKLVTEFIKL
jgi:endoglucanase